MTVVLRHNATLELNLVDYAGKVTIEQLRGIADYGAAHPDFLKRDTLSIVRENADFSSVELSALEALFGRYRKLFAALNFQIYRRAAWLCLTRAGDAHIGYWLGEHDLREVMSSNVRKFETYAEAGDWLLLSGPEIAQVERGEGFEELVCFESAAPATALAR